MNWVLRQEREKGRETDDRLRERHRGETEIQRQTDRLR